MIFFFVNVEGGQCDVDIIFESLKTFLRYMTELNVIYKLDHKVAANSSVKNPPNFLLFKVFELF